ncbi:nucleolus protein required for cell viability, putative [Talaromyces stipitatus ATCC 10500]|uniref:Nucleolus protein required for cell viability, putative n=1 Tax=Talaromyces stipitatus (strain ATCC 10500 / CBS 375.48 / QM 6759 / NRRL 1006) TaxID=441959 RepID=B8MTR6_TALSN|nr:nucleolus protein required for cell viability, putative [Talaromyces stipitatus ATCC 10500]EED12551.1 nucleolus protein required for cell viability, putative [Talaromyces stipitatus ATCC 10500]
MDTNATQSLPNGLDEDQYIQQLLIEAQARLQSSSSADKSLTSISEISQDIPKVPKLPASAALKPFIEQNDEVATINNSQFPLPSMVDPAEKSVSRVSNSSSKQKEKDNAGSDWFNLPKTRITTELKRDLQLLRMRNVLDPHRHYKKESGNAIPEYSQVGTIVEGPTEFFKSRIVKKERKQTFVDEVLAGEQQSGRFKTKYNQIQVAKTSGKKAYYNRLRAKRRR